MTNGEMVRILLEIQSELSSTNTMVRELSGPDGRVKKLEDEQRRNWWLTVAVGPVLAFGHAVARKFGIQV